MLKKLIEGNRRYLKKLKLKKSREQTAEDQKPFAAILSCSDSRVVPEYIFDTDIGEIFVVRTAGNVVDKVALGSIEYAVEHLGVPLLVVLGHSGCGAVKATLEGESGSENITSILEKIRPAADKVAGQDSEKVIDENIKLQKENILNQSPICRQLVQQEKLKIIGAKYNLSSRKVNVQS